MYKKIYSLLIFLSLAGLGYAGLVYNPMLSSNFDMIQTIEEEDGSPSVPIATTIKVTNGSLTDNADGTVSLATGAGGGGGDLLADGSIPLTADWNAGNSLYDITAVEFKGALKGNADTVTTITGLPPDTATTQATQGSITSIVNLTTVGTITTGTWNALFTADLIDDDDIDNTADVMSGSFGITIDGGGSAITTGVKGFIEIPYAMTIDRATVLLDQSGSIVIDVWLEQYVDYPPTDADSITDSTPPTVTTATKSEDTTLTSWTTSVTAGDIIGFNVDSATTATRAHLIISGDKL